MALPRDYSIPGCLHADVMANDLHNHCIDLPQKYSENLQFLLAADTQIEYRAC